MKSIFHVFVLIFTMVMSVDGILIGQVSGQELSDQGPASRKWTLSFTTGASFSSTRQQMESSLIRAGFGDTYVEKGSVFGIPYTISVNYPRITKSVIPWDMELRHALSSQNAVAVTISNSFHSMVEGYNFIPDVGSHFITLDSRVWLMSLDYIFTFQDSYTGLRIGPVMAMHQVSENGSTGSEQRKTTVKPGINLGFDAALFEKKSWFMAISMGYSWIPPVSIGPYEKIIHYATADGVDTITSIYPDSKIPLSSLKIGLTMGWKF